MSLRKGCWGGGKRKVKGAKDRKKKRMLLGDGKRMGGRVQGKGERMIQEEKGKVCHPGRQEEGQGRARECHRKERVAREMKRERVQS